MKIGIIGNVFVGGAILHGFILQTDNILIYDKDPYDSLLRHTKCLEHRTLFSHKN